MNLPAYVKKRVREFLAHYPSLSTICMLGTRERPYNAIVEIYKHTKDCPLNKGRNSYGKLKNSIAIYDYIRDTDFHSIAIKVRKTNVDATYDFCYATIMNKLKSMETLETLGESSDTPETYEPNEQPINKEKYMPVLNKYEDQLVANVTLINGVDAAEYTEEQFFRKIQQIQTNIEKLKTLPKSHYVESRIAGFEEDLRTIVDLMDATLGSQD